MHRLQYLNGILERFDIEQYNKVFNMMHIENKELRKKRFDKTICIQVVGCLLYLAMGTRPNIMYATCKDLLKKSKPHV